MKNLKVSKKLLISFGVLVALLSVTIIVAIIGINSVSGELKDFYNKAFPNVQRIDRVRANIQEGAKNMFFACVTPDESERQERLDLTKSMFTTMNEDMDYLQQNYRGDKSDLTTIQNNLDEMESDFAEFSTLCEDDDILAAFTFYSDNIMPELRTIVSTVETISTRLNEIADDDYQGGVATNRFCTILMIILGIVSIIIGVALALYITRHLVAGITELKDNAVKMSEGDFDVSIDYNSQDELGELASSMRHLNERTKEVIKDTDYILAKMAEGDFSVESQAEESYVGAFHGLLQSMTTMKQDLSEMLGQINIAADQVADGSEQLSYGAQSLSQGATQQASSVEELSATINTVSDQVNETAQNASSAKEQTNTSNDKIQVCNQQMDEMIEAMTEISDKSEQIGKIIKTIEDIAFQTNILALNAAVEAARAGEAGKGFAVVADEVRNLATKSQEASQNTSILIEGTVQAVEKGQGIVNDTASSLQEVVDSSTMIAKIVDEIAVAAKEQAISISQISEGIEQISSVVQTNSATAEESAAASQELSGQSQMLKDLISHFVLSAAHSSGPTIDLSTPPAHTDSESDFSMYASDKY